MALSRYDELLDRFDPVATGKHGTKYERLAALVLKNLHDQQAVIHDIKLVGASEVKHQIDVLVEDQGKKRRVLIECKDFDLSGQLVGLGIMRDFRSVVEDTGADDAFVLTCTGFTEPAQTYAKAKGIKLAVLRAFEEADWEGRVRRVVVTIHIAVPPQVNGIDLEVTEAQQADFVREMAAAGLGRGGFMSDAPIYLVSDTDRTKFIDYVNREVPRQRSAAPDSPVTEEVVLMVSGADLRLQIEYGETISFEKLTIRATTFGLITQTLEISNDRIAELILKGFGPDDIVIFEDQLKKLTVTPGGQVQQRVR